jgi:hypothetical protein
MRELGPKIGEHEMLYGCSPQAHRFVVHIHLPADNSRSVEQARTIAASAAEKARAEWLRQARRFAPER